MGRDLSDKQQKVSKQEESLHSLKLALSGLKANLKVHELSKSAYERDSHLQMRLMQAEDRTNKATAALDEHAAREIKKDEALKAQEGETKLLQRELDKIVDELQAVIASRTVLSDRWQEALAAMARRDRRFRAVRRHERRQRVNLLQLSLQTALFHSNSNEWMTHYRKKSADRRFSCGKLQGQKITLLRCEKKKQSSMKR